MARKSARSVIKNYQIRQKDIDEREPDEEDTYEYALLQDYFEGNLLILN